jgi:hypothetical protein
VVKLPCDSLRLWRYNTDDVTTPKALHNFYMLTGGNNYGRMAALHVATAYAPDTPIDNLLLRAPKYAAFAAFFKAVAAIEPELLGAPIPEPVQFPPSGHPPHRDVWRTRRATAHGPSVPPSPGPDPTFPVGAEYHE